MSPEIRLSLLSATPAVSIHPAGEPVPQEINQSYRPHYDALAASGFLTG
jgi:hypothetical protein